MNIFNAYISGLKSSGRSLLMTTWIYIVNLVLGLIVAIPFLGKIKEGSQNSLSIHNFLYDFDFTTFRELFSETNVQLNLFFRQGFWIAILFIIISIFLTGGILKIFSDKTYPFSIERFINGGREFFSRFFRLSCYMILVACICTLIVSVIFVLIISASWSGTGSEKQLFYISITSLGILLVILIYILIIADYARFIMVRNDSKKVLRSIWMSTKFVTRKIMFTYGLYLMLLVIPLVLIYLYLLLSRVIGMNSGVTVLVMFIIQQGFIWMRVFTRIWTFGSQFDYYMGSAY